MFLNILFYTLSFYTLNNFLIKYFNYENRDYIISSLHAIISVGISVLYLFETFTEKKYLEYSTISIGYAIYDVNNLRHPKAKNTLFLILHHFILIFCNTWLIVYKVPYVIKIVSLNFLAEVSTPFLNLSMYLYKNNLTKYKFFNVNIFNLTSKILVTSYLFFRIFLLTYLVWETAFYNNLYYFQIGLTVLNYYWFYKILKMSKIV